MLFRASQYLQKAREAERQARMQQRKRQKVRQVSFSLVAFTAALTTMYLVFNLRQTKTRQEIDVVEVPASQSKQNHKKHYVYNPVTALKVVPELLHHSSKANSTAFDSRVKVSTSQWHMGRTIAESKTEQVDGSDRGFKSSTKTFVEKRRGENKVPMYVADGAGTVLDSLEDQEDVDRPGLTLTGNSENINAAENEENNENKGRKSDGALSAVMLEPRGRSNIARPLTRTFTENKDLNQSNLVLSTNPSDN